MAHSQKHSGVVRVPWFNLEEWKLVHNLLFGDPESCSNKHKALKLLRVWKHRTPQLPSGVEGTVIILEAMMLDPSLMSHESLRTLYGASIMRFLNLCGATNEQQGTFYRTAKKNGIPDWLIDLRHEIAHDQTIPSKAMLEKGLKTCFDWLKRVYWEPEFERESKRHYLMSSDEIRSAFRLHCELLVIRFVHKGEVDFEELKGINRAIYKKLADQNFSTIKDAEWWALGKIRRYLLKEKDETISKEFGEILATFSSLLGSQTLTGEATSIWNTTFTLFAQSKLLIPLIESLLDLAAYDWLAEIFRSLSKKGGNINFDRCKSENFLHEIRNLNNDVIKCGNQCCLDAYLNLCEYSENYQKLIRSQLKEERNRARDFDLYDCQVLPTGDVFSSTSVLELSKESKVDESSLEMRKLTGHKRKWTLVEDTSLFHGVPLGVLPNQSRETNPLLRI